MTVGEKIRTYRTMRGISQKMLGELAGGINEVTIRKYEAGDRNPKPDQLLKIANALGISINIFMDFDIETVSDVLSLVFKMDESVDLEFIGDKDENGEYDPKTISIKFNNYTINKKLATWARAKDLVQKVIDSKDEFDSLEQYELEVTEMQKNAAKIKQSLADDNLVVKKGTEGRVIKLYTKVPWYPRTHWQTLLLTPNTKIQNIQKEISLWKNSKYNYAY